MDHVLHRSDDLADGLIDANRILRVVRRGHDARAFGERLRGLCLYLADPPVEDERERSAFRPCFGGHVAHEFAVGGESLPFGALESAFG